MVTIAWKGRLPPSPPWTVIASYMANIEVVVSFSQAMGWEPSRTNRDRFVVRYANRSVGGT